MNLFKKVTLFFLLFCSLMSLCAMETKQNWVQETRASQRSGSWMATDKKGNSVIVDGEMITKNSRIISDDLENLSRIYADSIRDSDVALIRSYPSILLLPPMWWIAIKMLFQWKSYKDILFDSYMEEINEVLAPESKDVLYIFTVSDFSANGDKSLLGSVMFGIHNDNDYVYGDIELFHLMIKPVAQGRGLSKILASAIFKLLPQIKRIFLDVNRTNTKAIVAYEAADFLKCRENRYTFEYEYLTKGSSKLQSVAAALTSI